MQLFMFTKKEEHINVSAILSLTQFGVLLLRDHLHDQDKEIRFPVVSGSSRCKQINTYNTCPCIYAVNYKIKGDKHKTPQRMHGNNEGRNWVGMYLESGDWAHCACLHSQKFQHILLEQSKSG